MIEATQEEETRFIRKVNKLSIQARKDLQQTKGIKSSSNDDSDQWLSSIQDEQKISDLAKYRDSFAHRLDSLENLSKELKCPGYTEFNKRLLVVSDVLEKYKEALQIILRYNQSTLYLGTKDVRYNSIQAIKLSTTYINKIKSHYIGWKEGRQEGEQSLVLRQLNRRIGDVSPELRSQIQALSLDQLEALGEALLDFSEPTDLVNWLQNHRMD